MKKEQILSLSTSPDFFLVQDVDYVEFYVGNAKQAAYYFCTAFGFRMVAYSGLETGERNKVSYVLEQNKIRFVLTGTLVEDQPTTDFVKKHGDGVKDIALRVDDVDQAFKDAVARGAISIKEPEIFLDQHGTLKKAIIGTYGDTIHTLIERKDYKGTFMPGYQFVEMNIPFHSAGLIGIDHVVGNVEKMDDWVSYYEKVMGFKQMIHFNDKDISTEYCPL